MMKGRTGIPGEEPSWVFIEMNPHLYYKKNSLKLVLPGYKLIIRGD